MGFIIFIPFTFFVPNEPLLPRASMTKPTRFRAYCAASNSEL